MKYEESPCIKAEITAPKRGRLRAVITTEEEVPLSGYLQGTEGVKFFCTRVHSSMSNGLYVSVLVAGYDGWTKEIESKHMLGPIDMLSVIVTTGSQVKEVVDASSVSQVVAHYTHIKGPALQVLDSFEWHIDAVGRTIVGKPRSGELVESVVVEKSDKASGEIRGNSPVLLLPGDSVKEVVGDTTEIHILSDVYMSEDGSFLALIEGESSIDKCLRELVRSQDRFTLDVYKATGQEYTRDNVDFIPDGLRNLESWIGPGHTATLAPSTPVLVGYQSGDRSKPFVVNVSPSVTPVSLSWEASASCTLKATSISLGPSGAVPVARAPETLAMFAALQTALASSATPLTAGVPVLDTALATILTTLAGALAPAPIASTSTKVD